LAHPGRLRGDFALTEIEKLVLRHCDGKRSSAAVHALNLGLNAAELTAFLKRCAAVKLITFRR
jgi:hypothetical protein